MPKRSLRDVDDALAECPPPKRLKGPVDRLSVLSDELILRILDEVSVATLALCSRVSHRLKTLSSDSQIWRSKYYRRFLQPRWRRRTDRVAYGLTATTEPRPARLARWLDEDRLLQSGPSTNWKQQYKLRDNWSKGICNLQEIPLASPPIPSLLGRLHADIIVTADKNGGLRIWTYSQKRHLIADQPFACVSHPTALAVDCLTSGEERTRIAVGFEDGSLELYSFDRASASFSQDARLDQSHTDRITGIAIAGQFLATVTHAQRLTLYATIESKLAQLNSLTSHSLRSPFSLSLRLQSDRVLICVAFAMPSLSTGWCTGIQEAIFTAEGAFMDSRLATSEASLGISPHIGSSSLVQGQHFSKPTSLSYSHPYMLVSHADNTLTLYLVTSKDNELSVSVGKRLWGHTSAVLGASVGGRGKAISVSSRGDEVRVWELEGATAVKKHAHDADDNYSIAVRPERSNEFNSTFGSAQLSIGKSNSESSLAQPKKELSVTKCWVGFDEERVVVVREQEAATQALAVYDFT